MRKTREVLRLYFELKLGQRQIARSANVSQSTVHEYLTRFTAAGLSWPLPAEMSEAELEMALFPTEPSKSSEPGAQRPLPDFAHLHEELQRHKHTTRQLLWEEYRAANPDGYGYSRFCHHYQRWKRERDLVLRQSIVRARSCSSIGRARPFLSTIPRPAQSTQLRCSWPCWEPVTTPTRKRTQTSKWPLDRSPRAYLRVSGRLSAARCTRQRENGSQ
jgi:hypothetical protein